MASRGPDHAVLVAAAHWRQQQQDRARALAKTLGGTVTEQQLMKALRDLDLHLAEGER